VSRLYVIGVALAVMAALGGWAYVERQGRLTAVARVSNLEAAVKGQQRSLRMERLSGESRRKQLREAEIAHEKTRRKLEEALAADAQSWGEIPLPQSIRDALE
jgi:hypothetical protein